MKFEINFTSFRFKIIISLILVITSVSFISFYFYNTSLSKMFYKNAEKDIYTFLHFFKDQMISIHDGRTLKPSLQELSRSKAVMNTYLLNAEGKVLFETQTRDLGIDTLNVIHLEDKKDDITLVTYNSDDYHFSRALIRFQN